MASTSRRSRRDWTGEPTSQARGGVALVNALRTVLSPERLYIATLALSGCAAVASISLPPAERGELAACMASATMGSAIGAFSIDTFLLSRPHGWVLSRGPWWILALAVGSIGLSAAAAASLIALAGVGSYLVALGAAAALTTFNTFASLALRLKRFTFVYTVRAAGAGLLIVGYGVLYLGRDLDGDRWSVMWLACQSLAALGVGVGVLRMARGFGRPDAEDPNPVRLQARYGRDLVDMGRLHVGACAQMLTYRLDQILLARFAGPGPLGVYALAVAALEFAQAGAVVAAQRILASRERTTELPRIAPVVRTALALSAFSVAALAGLGALLPSYRQAWLAGLCLLPGCLAVSVGKTWSASLLKRRGAGATSVVAVVTLAVAAPCYLILVPSMGMFGAAIASSLAYSVYAVATRLSLRARPGILAQRTA